MAFLILHHGQIRFDRQYDLSKARSVGFKETIDTVKGYTMAFDRMRAAARRMRKSFITFV
jgi:hypothetical protein